MKKLGTFKTLKEVKQHLSETNEFKNLSKTTIDKVINTKTITKTKNGYTLINVIKGIDKNLKKQLINKSKMLANTNSYKKTQKYKYEISNLKKAQIKTPKNINYNINTKIQLKEAYKLANINKGEYLTQLKKGANTVLNTLSTIDETLIDNLYINDISGQQQQIKLSKFLNYGGNTKKQAAYLMILTNNDLKNINNTLKNIKRLLKQDKEFFTKYNHNINISEFIDNQIEITKESLEKNKNNVILSKAQHYDFVSNGIELSYYDYSEHYLNIVFNFDYQITQQLLEKYGVGGYFSLFQDDMQRFLVNMLSDINNERVFMFYTDYERQRAYEWVDLVRGYLYGI